MIRRLQYALRCIGWLELSVLLVLFALLFQIWPSLGAYVLWVMDIDNWSSSAKFVVNLVFVLLLLVVRFGPDLLHSWRERRSRIASEQAVTAKATKMKKEREAIERMQQSRRRRMY